MVYDGWCDYCHNGFDNVPRWKVIFLIIKHRHLIDAILHSNAVFWKVKK